LSSNANLQGLTLSSGTLSPSFDASITSYSASVANAVSSVAIIPAAEETYSVIQVNGQTVTSGQASSGVSIDVGGNAIMVMVTAPDLTTTTTYTITITRAGSLSSNANLSSLAISVGSLSPSFDSSVISYTVSVGVSCGSITVTPTKSDPGATITANGTVVASGSGTIVNLSAGANMVTIIVTAEDASTTKTTTVAVNKEFTCEDRQTAVACVEASCEWSDGKCITPGVGSSCNSLDEDTCNETPGCEWVGVCSDAS